MTGTRHDRAPVAWHLRTATRPPGQVVQAWVRTAGFPAPGRRRGRTR